MCESFSSMCYRTLFLVQRLPIPFLIVFVLRRVIFFPSLFKDQNFSIIGFYLPLGSRGWLALCGGSLAVASSLCVKHIITVIFLLASIGLSYFTYNDGEDQLLNELTWVRGLGKVQSTIQTHFEPWFPCLWGDSHPLTVRKPFNSIATSWAPARRQTRRKGLKTPHWIVLIPKSRSS